MKNVEQFIVDVNQAFSEGNSEYLLNHITTDFCWIIVGERTVGGKTEFSEALKEMQDMPPMKISVDNIISTEKSAVVEGTVIGRNKNGQKKHFGFCDIYWLSGDKEIKIKRITSYVIDVSKHKQYKESF